MVLHSIVNEYDILQAQNQIAEPVYRKTEHGFVEYRKSEYGDIPCRIHTTDLSIYLTNKYNI